MVSEKKKKILICVFYNLMLEYWVHGIIGFINPILSISLFILYLTYFSMLEDLVIRFNLRDHHVLLIGFIFGLFQETFNTGSSFNNPNFLDVNVFNIFMANVLWWGILQSIFGLYFANKVVANGQEVENKMSVLGWIICLAFYSLMLFAIIFEGILPEGSLLGYIVCLLLMGITTLFLIILLVMKPTKRIIIEPITFINKLLWFQFFLCIIMGTILIYFLGIIALYLFILWSVITGIVYFVFISKGKRFIGQIQQ